MFQQFLYHHLNAVSPSALLFPAVNPRRRFLIHKTVEENFPDLATVSVGQDEQRRTAVTYRNIQEATTPPKPSPATTPRQQQQRGKQQQPQHRNKQNCERQASQEESLPKTAETHSNKTLRDDKKPQQCSQQRRGSTDQKQKGPRQPVEQRQRQQQQEGQQKHPTEPKQQQRQQQQQQQNHRRASVGSQQQTEQQTERRQQQQTRQVRRRNNRSRSSSSQSVTGGGRGHQPQKVVNEGGKNDDHVKENTEETQSKKRRNRRNKRGKDKTEQQQGKNTTNNGQAEDCDKEDNNAEQGSDSVLNRGCTKGRHHVYESGVKPTTVKQNDGDSEWSGGGGIGVGVNCNGSDGGIRKKLKSFGESNNWKNSRDSWNTSEEYDSRLSPVSSRKENSRHNQSWSSNSPSGRGNPERMPVTMPPEHYTDNNRRRGKASAQIYRPPPARSTKEDTNSCQPQQPQQCPHYQHQESNQQKQQQFYQQHYNSYQQDSHQDQYPQENHYQQQPNHHPYQVPSSRQRTDSESSNMTTSGDYQNKGRGRRPDQVLYVPRGRRNVLPDCSSARGTPTPMHDYEHIPRPPSPTYSVCSVASEFSGRNRYNNKQGSHQGSQLSVYEGETDKVKGKPPISKGDFSRESTPGYGRNKGGGGGRFNSQTLQLIERCLNQDSETRHSEHSHWENDSINSSPSPKNNKSVGVSGGGVQKSPTPTRDIHSVHSKENVIHPVESSQRSRRSRRNRRRHSRSREPSADQNNDAGKNMGTKGSVCHTSNNRDQYNNGLGDRGFGSCERVFYNSNYNTSHERYDRGYDNYDRYCSINNSRTSSRNSSRERTPQQSPSHSWRGGSNPASPAKGNVYYHTGTRNSPGKPPSGRLGSLPNVAFEFGDGTRRAALQASEENVRWHTLPVKHHKSPSGGSRSYSVENSKTEENRSSCSISDRVDQITLNGMNQNICDEMDQEVSYNRSQDTLDNCGKDNHRNSDNLSPCDIESPPLNDVTTRLEETSLNIESDPKGSLIDSSFNNSVCSDQSVESSNCIEKDTKCKQNCSVLNNQQSDNQYEASDVPSGMISEEEVFYEAGTEVTVTESREESAEEMTSSDNDVKEGKIQIKEQVTEEKEEKKNLKKFSFNWADEVEDSWDNLYDDTGECLAPDIKRQLSDSIGDVKLEKPANDYYTYQPKEPQINEEEYAHVIEIYDFPVSFKTQDLMMVFNSFQNTGFDIKWVDDTHALGIFATGLIAAEALSIDHPFLKTRSLALATKTSKAKATRITEALLPYKPRPATSASLARRLVSGALGLKVNISREVREAEKQKLKDAKARKKLAAKQRLDAWEGNLT
ncbi:putative uncharacterized protein DDB_G0291608 isoform X2 [Homarus americanus]|uniref:putative uncharacterized protein DDB_G0291608 isoform X2 n=1 Tax=Homarus americanus TaxID=6706 RepID=UPI001C45212B|nr:putative uncharacterized protein DDB_G0291608 isoform X2 [Homarus americanus]XP_042225539.1 putative uncharacterized protein DDB_G0291608 isoform X2 [Homarus americanus]